MCLEKHGRGAEQACRMLDTFASLQISSFDLTRTDIDGQKRSFCPQQGWEKLRQWMASLIESATRCQHNLIVRPKSATVELIQLDDVSEMILKRLRDSAFLMLTTSAGNHQAWVAVRECRADFARRLRQGSGADPSASGATRVAGSLNFKRQYAPEFPMVSILEAIPRRIATPEQLEALGLVAAFRQSSVVPPPRIFRSAKRWPSYERCLQNAPLAHQSKRRDVSRADFTFCLIALDWGWSLAETCQRLLDYSSKACEQGEPYARLTAQRAYAALQRRRAEVTS